MVVPGATQTVAPLSSLALFTPELLVHHEALAVVVGDGREIEAERGVALERDRGVVRQQVDLARLQRGEALLRGQRHVLDLLRIAEDRRRAARQTSTSRPTHLPWLSATAKPAMPVGTPQITAPRALMASRSLPAIAAPEARERPPVRRPRRTAGAWSPDRRGVLQAALRPQLVEAALDPQRRAPADVALEALAVVPTCLTSCRPTSRRRRAPCPCRA